MNKNVTVVFLFAGWQYYYKLRHVLMVSWLIIATVDGVNEQAGNCIDDDPICNSTVKHLTSSEIAEDCDFVSCPSISQSYWSVGSNHCDSFS